MNSALPDAVFQTLMVGGSGTIQGTVTDPTGAVVPGATVVATNNATGVKTTRETTQAGVFVISPLNPGEYTLTVSATGFQTLTISSTAVLIVVGVALDTMKQLEAQLMMRNYEGFLK